MAIAILMGFVSGGCSAGLIALISHTMGRGEAWSIPLLALWFVGLVIISLSSTIITQVLLIRLSQQSVCRLQIYLCRQILASELIQIEALGTSRLLATLTEDIQAISKAIHLFPLLCIDIAIILGCFIYITWLSWKVLVFILVLFTIAMGSCLFLLNRGKVSLKNARVEQDILFKHFQAVINGIKELKLHSFRRYEFLSCNLQPTVAGVREHNIHGLIYFAATTSLGKFIFFLAIGFVLFALPNLIQSDSRTMTGYILTFIYITLPMENLVNKLPIITQAGIALDKIESLELSLTPQTEYLDIAITSQTQFRTLTLKGVMHNYFHDLEATHFTLGPIDLSIHSGELLFIVGGNGSGKSTLAKIITGLYCPEQGELLLNGKQINQNNLEHYRQFFSAIFFDFYLFDQLLGLDNAEHSMVHDLAKYYLKKLHLDRKVSIHNGKFSTTKLSQGQRKRLALLLALLENRPIYIFDEWAADQDPSFKKIFYTEVLTELKQRGRTILVISHDDQYFYLADRVIKLVDGQIVLA